MRNLLWSVVIIVVFLFGVFTECFAEYKDVAPENSVAKVPPVLTLRDAIMLAVRTNPNVQSTQMSHTLNKFDVWIQEWQFLPHYSLTASAGEVRNGYPGQRINTSRNMTVTPAVTVLTPIGTKINLTATNHKTYYYNPGLSVEVSQPLLRGFGRPIVETALNNAKESEIISRLNVESILRTTITSVIKAYLGLLNAEKRIVISEDSLKRSEDSVTQTQKLIKAGSKAGNEIVTVEAEAARARVNLERDQNNLKQARFALLTAIGIDPNTPVRFADLDIPRLIRKYHLPTLAEAKIEILNNDIQFQTDQITLHGSKRRSVLTAEDNMRWQLNFNASAGTGGGSGPGYNAGINSMVNGQNQNQTVGFSLQIPIDDQASKQALMSAKIGLKQAELALMQEKWGKETSAINAWNLVISNERALEFAKSAEELQQKTWKISYQKYMHGLIDSLQLQTAQVALIDSQQSLLSAQIEYLSSLVDFDALMGRTLKTWDVKARFS